MNALDVLANANKTLSPDKSKAFPIKIENNEVKGFGCPVEDLSISRALIEIKFPSISAKVCQRKLQLTLKDFSKIEYLPDPDAIPQEIEEQNEQMEKNATKKYAFDYVPDVSHAFFILPLHVDACAEMVHIDANNEVIDAYKLDFSTDNTLPPQASALSVEFCGTVLTTDDECEPAKSEED